MLNPKRSYPSSYFDMEVNSRPRVPSHLRSASDSFALLKQPCFVKSNTGNSFFTRRLLERDLLKQPCFVKSGTSNSFTTRGLFERDQSVTKFDEVTKHFENVLSKDNSISGIKVPLIPNSSTVAEQQNATQCRQRHGNALDSESKSKRIKRIVSNRLSAQRSRLRKVAYVEKLKRDVKAEEAKVSWLSPQVSLYLQHQMALKTENTHIKEIMRGLEKEKAMKEAEFQSLKKELEALRGAFMGMLSN